MPRQQPESVDVTAYIVIEPRWSNSRDAAGRPILEGAKVAKVTQARPESVRGDSLVTRITFAVDADALLPLQPQAVVHIGAQDVEVMQVVAEHPGDEE